MDGAEARSHELTSPEGEGMETLETLGCFWRTEPNLRLYPWQWLRPIAVALAVGAHGYAGAPRVPVTMPG